MLSSFLSAAREHCETVNCQQIQFETKVEMALNAVARSIFVLFFKALAK